MAFANYSGTKHFNSNPASSGVFCGLFLVNKQILRIVWNEELKYVLYVGKKLMRQRYITHSVKPNETSLVFIFFISAASLKLLNIPLFSFLVLLFSTCTFQLWKLMNAFAKDQESYLSSVTLGTGPALLPPWHWLAAEWMRNRIRKMGNETSVAVLENIAPRSFTRTWKDLLLRQDKKLGKGHV